MNKVETTMILFLTFAAGFMCSHESWRFEGMFNKPVEYITVKETDYDINNSREIRILIDEKKNEIDNLRDMDIMDRYREYLQEEEGMIQEKDMSDCSEFDRWER